MNYVGTLLDNEYLKFSCDNKGKCCNIHHMKKYTYNALKNNTEQKNDDDVNNNVDLNKNKHTLSDSVQINVDKNKLIVEI